MIQNLATKNNNWAIVPAKTLTEAKSRLSPVLTIEQRQHLALNLLKHTLIVLRASKKAGLINGFVVISPGEQLGEVVTAFGGDYLVEARVNSNASLNVALGQAARWCVINKEANTLLILPTDLPFMTLEDLQEVITDAPTDTCLIVPDTLEQGTNALLLKPATQLNFTYFFGEGSFRQHREALLQEGASLLIKRNPGLTFDLDLPEDLTHLSPDWWDNLPETADVINK